MPAGFATGKNFMRGQPREAKGLLRGLRGQPREAEGLLRGQPREAESLLRGLRGQPREATCRAEAKRRRKPFTRMAKWEIRFQRFALSFRPSAL
jgi:hypothetical protein